MDTRELAQALRKKNSKLTLKESLDQAERMNRALDVVPVENGSLFDTGPRDKGEPRPRHGQSKRGEVRPRKRRYPTNSERLNRALVELNPMAFKVHALLCRWRGAPAKGLLPFFTVSSLARFCGTHRPEISRGMKELVGKGWIKPGQYDVHKKNSLYRLVPIRDIRKSAVSPAG